MDNVLVELSCISKPRVSFLGFAIVRSIFHFGTYSSLSRARGCSSIICFVLFMFIYGTILRAYLVRNPDRNIFLRSILARFLVRKWDNVVDGGLPAGPEIEGDPAGLTQLFPCPLD